MTTLSESKARRPRPLVSQGTLVPPLPASRGWGSIVWMAAAAAVVSSLLGAKFLLRAGADVTAAGQPGGAAGAGGGGDGVICHGAYETQLPIAVLSPTMPGRVLHVLAVEGRDYKAGDVLLVVDDAAAAEAVAQAKIALEAAKVQLKQAQHLVVMHARSIEEQKNAIEAADARGLAAKAEADGTEKSDSINRDMKNAKAQLANAIRVGAKAERAKMETLLAMKPEYKVDEAVQAVEAAKSRVAQAERALGECSVKAPEDGRVLRIGVAVGTVFGPQSRVSPILFLPTAAQPVVRVEIEQDTAHRVHKDDKAILTDKFNGNNKWEGKVLSVADAYLPRRAATDAVGLQADVKVLECIIVLDANTKTPPKIGQPIRAEIHAPAAK